MSGFLMDSWTLPALAQTDNRITLDGEEIVTEDIFV